MAVLVTAASVQDSTAGRALLGQVAADHPGLRKVWVDGGYRKHFIEHAATTLGIDLAAARPVPGTTADAPTWRTSGLARQRQGVNLLGDGAYINSGLFLGMLGGWTHMKWTVSGRSWRYTWLFASVPRKDQRARSDCYVRD